MTKVKIEVKYFDKEPTTLAKIDPPAFTASVSNAKESVCKGSKQKGVDVANGSSGAIVVNAASNTLPSNIEIEDLSRNLNGKVQLIPAASNQLVLHGKESEAMSGDQKVLLKGHASQYVKLNVGGRLYYTTIGTLTKHNDTMLSAMFSGRMEVLTDSEGLFSIQLLLACLP